MIYSCRILEGTTACTSIIGNDSVIILGPIHCVHV